MRVSEHRPRFARLALVCLGIALLVRLANPIAIALETTRESVSSGTPSHGSLRDGRRLPSSGPNFETTSHLGAALGRNTVHRRVRDAVLATYGVLARELPDRRWQYAETGWPSGGRFRPHRTHQNGLSVDFVVPVETRSHAPTTLFSWVGNQWTYGIELDPRGCRGDVCIDFVALERHLSTLSRQSLAHGLRIERVIFAPEYHRALFATPRGARLREDVPFVPWRAWVRHDEHYHVDFSLVALTLSRGRT